MKMNQVSQLRALLLASSLFFIGCSNFFLGDENLSEAVDLPSNPNKVELQRQWRNRVGDGTDEKALKLQPLVTTDRIVAVSADGSLQSYARDNGRRQWRNDVGHRIAAGVAGNERLVVIGSENGLLMAFSATDGKPLWTYPLSTEIVAPPTVAVGLVVARTIDGQVTALSEKSGQVIWKQNIGVAKLSIRGNARGLFADGVLLFTNGKGRMSLLSIRDGRPVLDTSVSRGRGITMVERVADLLATPTIRKGILFLSAYRHETLAINLKDGSLLWKSNLATALDLFADNRYLYVVDKNSIIYALNSRNGKTAWKSRVAEGRHISPVAGNGRQIAFVDNTGKLIVLDSRNGALLGYRDVGAEQTYVAPQWLGGQWLTYTSNGELALTNTVINE